MKFLKEALSLSVKKEEEILILKRQNTSNEHLNGRYTWRLIFSIAIAVFGSSFTYGLNIGMYNIPWKVINEFFNEVHIERYGLPMSSIKFTRINSMINGLLPLGGIFGSLFSGYIADKYGRKNGLLKTTLLVIISSILNASSVHLRSYEVLMISRFLAGIYCGIFTGILPLYLNELPPQNLRGSVGTLNQLTIVLGILVANILGLPNVLGNRNLWPVLVSSTMFPAIVNLVGLLFAIESPKYLFNANRHEDTINALIKLRGKNYSDLVELEVQELVDASSLKNKESLVWMDFLRGGTLSRALFIAISIKIFQFTSGINAVVFYSTAIFTDAGLKDKWPTYATIMLSLVQFTTTLVTFYAIERAGRRFLLLVSCIGMSYFSFSIATSMIFENDERTWLYFVTVGAAIGYLVFYSIGLGPVSWIIVTELFDSGVGAKANSIVTFFSWSSNFFVTVSFPYLEVALKGYSFFVYGVGLVFISLFVFLFVPETRNLSATQIFANLEKGLIVKNKKDKQVCTEKS